MIAIDLGSNTFRAVDMDCNSLERIAEYEKIVRTADGLSESGCIGEDAIARIVQAAKEAREVLDFSKPVTAVATEAIRRASNGAEVLDVIEKKSGLKFRVLTGEQEAGYTQLAVKARLEKLGIGSDSFVLADIGGGSTEIVFFREGETRMMSFSVGIVTIAQRYKTPEAIERALKVEMEPIQKWVQTRRMEGFDASRFVATAGTPTTVAAMKLGMDYASYDAQKINGVKLLRKDLSLQLKRLLALDNAARKRLVGVGREDLIVAGILIFDKLYEILGVGEAIVVDDGLREGVAIAECKGLKGDEIF
ncbi:Ppx/GppA phosphatase family protein [Hydrogenimonas sp.]